VGDHDDGHAGVFLDFFKKHEDGFASRAVEISGGLIGEEDFWAVDEGASDGGALLLAAGEFAGAMSDAFAEADALKSFVDAGGAVAAVDFGEAERELDIFLESHAREEIERLEDHADGLTAVARQFE
jgi:hypothetical protein